MAAIQKKMSVEKLQLLHEDYIRLTERFKALWTFHQFLRGIGKTFSPDAPEPSAAFNGLYEEVRAAGAELSSSPPEAVARRLQELFARLDTVAQELRDADRGISPSLVRRFFDKIRPQDEKIAFYLLRFYFAQPDVDEDVIDKVDFLATVAATGRPEPDATATRPRAAIRQLFESVTASSVWPRMEAGMTPAVVRAFDELASDVTQAREFEQLLTERLLNNARTMKRRPRGPRHPDGRRLVQSDDAFRLPSPVREGRAAARRGHRPNRRPRARALARRRGGSAARVPAISRVARPVRPARDGAKPARAAHRKAGA